MKSIQIKYRPGKDNCTADALSRCPASSPLQKEFISTTQITVVQSEGTTDIWELLAAPTLTSSYQDFSVEQSKDPELQQLLCFIQNGKLPESNNSAHKVAAQAPLFTLVDGVFFFVNPKYHNRKQCVVPKHLTQTIMEEHHSSLTFLVRNFMKSCQAIGGGRVCLEMVLLIVGPAHSVPSVILLEVNKTLLHPIPVEQVFQIIGVDIMDLPPIESGNHHVVVFQDFLSKWPLVFPVPDQKAKRLACLLMNAVVPFCVVPEALLSDRGTNFFHT